MADGFVQLCLGYTGEVQNNGKGDQLIVRQEGDPPRYLKLEERGGEFKLITVGQKTRATQFTAEMLFPFMPNIGEHVVA